MANYQPSVTLDDVFTALRGWLLQVLSEFASVEVVQGQVNRVPPPKAQNFVVMWPLRNMRLSTAVETWDDTPAEIMDIARSTRLDIQLDVHGDDSADMAQVIATLWRSSFGVDTIPDRVFAPLFDVNPRQIPFINGEDQYENRWVIELSLQITPQVSTPMQYADKLHVNVMPPADRRIF